MHDDAPRPPINLAPALLGRFDEPGPTTIGVEEEYFLVDAATGLLRWDAPALVDALDDARFTCELPAAQIEQVTPPCADLRAVHERLLAGRRELLARSHGLAFLAAGTPPTATTVDVIPDQPRYHETFALHRWAARQQLVAALQVHVAIRPIAVAVAVHDALRSYLPELVGLAASAPLLGGVDTGLATARPLIAGLLPRQGIPPILGSVDGYRETLGWMAAAGVADERRLWWEVRLRPAYGTIEVRAMDSQPTARGAATLTAFAAGLTCWLADRARDGEPLPRHAAERIAESRWRAVRDGRRAWLLDLDSGEKVGLAARVGRLVEQIGPTVEALGGGALLAALSDPLAHDVVAAQREVAAGRGADGVVRWLTERFAT